MKLAKLAAAGLAAAVLLFEGGLLAFAYLLTHPTARDTSGSPATFGVANYRTVWFPSADGTARLDGWLLSAPGSRRTVIFAHGQGDNKLDTLGPGNRGTNAVELARFFLGLGYNALLFDFRGQGGLPATGTTLGFREQDDLLGAIRFTQSLNIAAQVGVVGFSLGAGVALLDLDRTNSIAFVVADSPPSSLAALLSDKLSTAGLLAPLANASIRADLQLFWGIPVDQLSVVRAVSSTAVPVLLIYGSQDREVPPREQRALEAALRSSNSRAVLFPGAGHVQSYLIAPQRYEEAIASFLSTNQLCA